MSFYINILYYISLGYIRNRLDGTIVERLNVVLQCWSYNYSCVSSKSCKGSGVFINTTENISVSKGRSGVGEENWGPLVIRHEVKISKG